MSKVEVEVLLLVNRHHHAVKLRHAEQAAELVDALGGLLVDPLGVLADPVLAVLVEDGHAVLVHLHRRRCGDLGRRGDLGGGRGGIGLVGPEELAQVLCRGLGRPLLGGHAVDMRQEGLCGVGVGVLIALAVGLVEQLDKLLLECGVETHEVHDRNLNGRGLGWGRRGLVDSWHRDGWNREQFGEEASAHLVAGNLEGGRDAVDGGGEVIGECGVHSGSWLEGGL